MNRLTSKQEDFCQHYIINGGNATKAYQSAYNCENMKLESIHRVAHEQIRKEQVAHRIKELQQENAKNFRYTKDEVMKSLESVIDNYLLEGKLTGNALKAIEILNKMNGWNEPDKLEHSGISEINIILPKRDEEDE